MTDRHGSNAAHAQGQAAWTVSTVSGDVRHSQDGGAPATLAVGDEVGVGGKVTTGPNARVVLTRGTESMTLAPKGEIAIPKETGGLLTRIVQNLGTLLLNVDKKPEQHFEVKTPYLAAVVKGTTFTVNVDKGGSAVHVVTGLVQVNDLVSGQSGLVHPGRTGIVTSKPGGGLKISGGRAKQGVKHAKAKAAKDKAVKADAKAAKAGAKVAAKAAKTDAKGAKGPVIKSALGITKINIVSVTKGFLRSDGAGNGNAGKANGKTKDGENNGNNGAEAGTGGAVASNNAGGNAGGGNPGGNNGNNGGGNNGNGGGNNGNGNGNGNS